MKDYTEKNAGSAHESRSGGIRVEAIKRNNNNVRSKKSCSEKTGDKIKVSTVQVLIYTEGMHKNKYTFGRKMGKVGKSDLKYMYVYNRQSMLFFIYLF